MALTLRHTRPQPKPAAPPPPSPAPAPRRPFRDNTKLILTGIAVVVAALVRLLALASRSATLAPDFLTEFVLYALSATNLTILVGLVFVLARNIIKLFVERRRALPFARFRAKLVAVLLGMTLIPAVLVLLVGSELIRNSVDRWFNAPMDEMLSSANAIAGDYYQEQQRLVSALAQRYARSLVSIDLASETDRVRSIVTPDVLQDRLELVQVYRVGTDAGTAQVVPVVDVAATTLPAEYSRSAADRLAQRTAASATEAREVAQVGRGGEVGR